MLTRVVDFDYIAILLKVPQYAFYISLLCAPIKILLTRVVHLLGLFKSPELIGLTECLFSLYNL